MNHPKSMFQLSGVHCTRVKGLGFGLGLGIAPYNPGSLNLSTLRKVRGAAAVRVTSIADPELQQLGEAAVSQAPSSKQQRPKPVNPKPLGQ